MTRSAAARIALRPFSGSTPAWAARPWTVTRVSRIPLRDETMSPFARAHSRTRQTSDSAAISRMWGVERRRADLLVRVGDERQPLERAAPPARATSALSAYSPASSPDFMSVTPGPWAIPSRRSRTAARRRCPGRRPCPCGRSAGPAAPPASPWPVAGPDHRRAERPAGIGPDLDGRARGSVRNAADEAPDLVDARPACSEPQSMLTSRSRSRGRPAGRPRSRPRARSSSASRWRPGGLGVHRSSVGRRQSGRRRAADTRGCGGRIAILARTVRLVEIRLLEGPNVYRLEPVVKVEVAIGRRRTWYGQRDPGRHALVHLGADVPARDWPRRDRGVRRLGPPAPGRPRRGPRRRRRPSLVGSRATGS